MTEEDAFARDPDATTGDHDADVVVPQAYEPRAPTGRRRLLSAGMCHPDARIHEMPPTHNYPVGSPGRPWSVAERSAWVGTLSYKRSYRDDVIRVINTLRSRFDVIQYGDLPHHRGRYPLFAMESRTTTDDLPSVLITGGVHGYETSGVHGALAFATTCAPAYEGKVHLTIVPCVSPWAYEVIQRWNRQAVDPNRSFGPFHSCRSCRSDRPTPEASILGRHLAARGRSYAAHIDLHETTDSDETEFRRALAARDGLDFEVSEIPDGFYLVDDTENPQPNFQQAIIKAVSGVTHIARPDRHGEIIGAPVVAHGVIQYPYAALGLCASLTQATYTTTTEVYPDSPRATPSQCNAAQVAAIRATLDYVATVQSRTRR
ncbi:MAG: M14 family metallocarboxypeptidase [Nannocystaceae bacterium]